MNDNFQNGGNGNYNNMQGQYQNNMLGQYPNNMPGQYQQPYPQPPKKSGLSTGCIVAIVVCGVIFLAIVGLVLGLGFLGFKVVEEISKNPDILYVSDLNKSYTIKDVTLSYSPSWIEDKKESNELVLSYINCSIRFVEATTDYYTTSENLANEAVTNYKKQGYEITKDVEEVVINDVKWYKIETKFDGKKGIQLFYASDYDTYSFAYIAKEENFDDNLAKVKDIYNTMKLDTSSKQAGADIAKKFFQGEWDWGTMGYLVVDGDNFYLYQDSSKSMKNVMYGKVSEFDNKIKTYGSGYADGYYFMGYYDAVVYDGVTQDSFAGNGLAMAITKNDDGTYTGQNITTRASKPITKVK